MTALDGSDGRDTVIFQAAVLNTTSLLPDTGFEIVGAGNGLADTVNITNLGTGVDTLKLFGMPEAT